ncbi:MAG: ATP-dependent transcriptional regulator, MalT-like, LuxR family [Clostridiales bacterium]|nr:ATP-dependent transcriptional regulator, MalT-like, LuxR family [Clostridiales bacterium]
MDKIFITDNNIVISEETHKEWKKKLNQYGRLYLYAMSGFGKSSNAVVFAEKQFSKWTSISTFEEDFLEKAEAYLIKNENVKVRTLLILDDLQWLLKKEEQDKLVELLSRLNTRNGKLQCMMLSRAPLPDYLKPFYLTKHLIVEGAETLWLKGRHIKEVLIKEKLFEGLDEYAIRDMVKLCINITKGYPIGVSSVIRYLKEGNRNYEVINRMAREDIFQYFDRTLFIKWEEEQKEAMIKLTVYPEFNIPMAKCILGERAKELIESIALISSFFSFTPPDKYKVHKFFIAYLRNRQQTLSKEERSIIYCNAGNCYEKMRELNNALRCYKEAGQNEKVTELIIYLSENVDGNFVRNSETYFNDLPEEIEERYPKLLGAKTLLLSYRMKIEESNKCLEKLKKKMDEEKNRKIKDELIETYVHTLIALPHGTSDEVKDKLTYYSSYILKHGIHLKNIIPTGNMPSVINGGLDFLRWEKNDKLLYPIMKKATEIVVGKEAIGITDVCMGENLYEKNRKTEAISYLTKGLSDSNYKGSIRVQYAATGVMARLFLSEGQLETAETTLMNILAKARETKFLELIPNIQTSLVFCELLKGNNNKTAEWLEKYAPNEYERFYITERFRLLTKARIYVSMGRNVEALFILNILAEYAKLYDRSYLQIEIQLLKAIILYKCEEEWQPLLIETVQKASSYSYVHILSDQGGALLPLWKIVDWNVTGLNPVYINAVTNEMKKMAANYPNYMKEIDILSKKELEVIKLMSEGHTNAEIAAILEISIATVKFHISNLLKKLKSENRTIAVKTAQEKGLL